MAKPLSEALPKVERPKQANNDNLYLWRTVEMTDPKHTKPVSIGRKLTAIDSYYQIRRATEAFGPFGLGWGYGLEHEVLGQGEAAMAKVEMTFWYVDPEIEERIYCGPIIAMNRLMLGGKPDEEAFKKAITDALTKSLSYLGFSADIFMGRYEDSKYMEQITKHFAAVAQKETETLKVPEALTKAIAEVKALKNAADLPTFVAIKERIRPEMERLTDKAAQRYVALQFREVELRITPPPAEDADRGDAAA